MRFKVIGTILEDGKRREIEYGTFSKHWQACDYQYWLEDARNWKDDPDKQPYMVRIDIEEGYDEEY